LAASRRGAGVEMWMGRLSAIFVAVCMVVIAGSVGAVLYLRFGLGGPESGLVAVAILTGLILYNVVSSRLRDRGDFGGQIGDLSRGTSDLGRQVAEISRRLATIENSAQAAVDKAVGATKPLAAELGEVGTLIKQLAETVAAHDTQLRGRSGGTFAPPPASSLRPNPPAPAPTIAQAPTIASPPVAPPAPIVKPPPVVPSAALAAPTSPSPAPTKPLPDVAAAPPAAPAAPVAAEAPAVPATPAAPVAPAVSATQIAAGRFKGLEPDAVVTMVRDAVEADRIDLLLQPIVTLPQRKVRYYEAVARLRAADGEQIMAADFLAYAEQAGLMPKIDNLMLFRCVQVVRRLLAKNREIGLFCNVSLSTLVDSASFPQFLEFMEANKAIAPALVFEFTQAAYRSFGPIENESLAALAERGFRFSMDQISDLRIEPRDLAERGFRFVKVPSPVLLNRAGPATTDIHPADFAGLLSRFGIELIGTMIESEGVVVDLLDYEVKFGQGFLFSPPRPVRPEVMQGIADRNDVIARDGEPAPAPAAASEAKPVASQRISSLAQLARGVIARG